jgi:hypothetical protein
MSASAEAVLTRKQIEELAAAQLADSGITAAEYGLLGITVVMPDDAMLRKLRVAKAPGILHRYFMPNNELNGLQRVRYLRGYEPPDPNRPGKVMRYGHPLGKPEEIYLPPFRPWEQIFADVNQPICCTEGWLKAIAGCKFLDLNVLSYDGIWNWGKNHRLLPIFNEIRFVQGGANRIVYVLNDRDVVSNPQSTQAENEFARLLLERGADVRLCRWPGNSKYGKLDDAVALGGKDRKWFDRFMLKTATVFDLGAAQLTEGIPATVTEDKQANGIFSIAPIPKGAMYGIAEKLTKRFGTPPSLTYPAVLTALSACRLPTTGETRTALFTVLLATVAAGKSVYVDRGGQLAVGHTTVIETLPVSDRGLLQMLQGIDKGDGPPKSDNNTHHALLLVDELIALLRKANIEGSNLYANFNSLWSKNVMAVADKKGVHESNIVRLSMLGCLPCKTRAQFADAFGSDAQLGFYSRCLFGVSVKQEEFQFVPLGDAPKGWLKAEGFYGSQLEMPKKFYAAVEEWKKSGTDEQRARRDNRLGELMLRVALVTSSASGDKEVTDEAFEAAKKFIEWQETIRAVYTPASFKTPYAQCMDMVLTHFENATGYVDWHRASHNRNWYKQEFSQHLSKVKNDLITAGHLVPVPGMRNCFYYRKVQE